MVGHIEPGLHSRVGALDFNDPNPGDNMNRTLLLCVPRFQLVELGENCFLK